MFWWLIILGMQDTLLSLWKSSQISSLTCWKLTVATCVWSVKICKSSQSQVSSLHFSEYFLTEPVLVFSVRQLLRLSRIHVSILSSCCAGPTTAFLSFSKNGYFQLLLTNELQYLKWVKEIFPRFLLLADRRCKRKKLSDADAKE